MSNKKAEKPFEEMMAELDINTATRDERLSVMSYAPNWQARYTVALDTNAPREVLERLAMDEHIQVRLQASRTMLGERTMLKHKIGMYVCSQREARGVSQTKLADMITISIGRRFPQTIVKSVEEGATSYTIDSLEHILNALNATLDFVISPMRNSTIAL